MATQFCPECPTDMPEFRQVGQWVEVEGHEHELPPLKAEVYQSCDEPVIWTASLHLNTGNQWLGQRDFEDFQEAISYAITLTEDPPPIPESHAPDCDDQPGVACKERWLSEFRVGECQTDKEFLAKYRLLPTGHPNYPFNSLGRT